MISWGVWSLRASRAPGSCGGQVGTGLALPQYPRARLRQGLVSPLLMSSLKSVLPFGENIQGLLDVRHLYVHEWFLKGLIM